MRKIIYEHPISNAIILQEVTASGGLSSGIVAIWDEKTHGKMPAIVTPATLPGIERSGDSLRINQAKITAYNTAKSARDAAESQRLAERQTARNKMATILVAIEGSDMSDDAKALMKDLFRMIKHRV